MNEQPEICPNCEHSHHLPGTECETPVAHGPNRWHLCLCLARPGASAACPPQMTCQGGTLGYSDIWYLQRGHSVLTGNGEISPEALTIGPTPADQNLRDRIAQAALHAVEAALGDTLTPSARGEALAGIAAVLPAPADQAPPLLSEVWAVWCEDESTWGYFATEDTGKTGTIVYYQEQEERCPDYGWRQDGPRLELLAGGELTGIYLSRHPVYGKPPSVDRADLLREAADAIVAEFPGPDLDRYTRYGADFLRRMASEARQTEPRPPITNYVVEIYDADEWLISNARTDDLDSSRAKLRARRAKWPDMPLRIVRSVETYTVVEADDPTACVSAPCPHPGDCRHGCRAAADQLTQLGQDMQAGECGAELVPRTGTRPCILPAGHDGTRHQDKHTNRWPIETQQAGEGRG